MVRTIPRTYESGMNARLAPCSQNHCFHLKYTSTITIDNSIRAPTYHTPCGLLFHGVQVHAEKASDHYRPYRERSIYGQHFICAGGHSRKTEVPDIPTIRLSEERVSRN